MKISINIIWQSKCHCGCSPRCISFVLIYSGELKRQRDCDWMRTFWLLNAAVTTVAGKCHLKLVTLTKEKSHIQSLCLMKWILLCQKLWFQKNGRFSWLYIHGPVTDIMMFFWIIVHLIHICMSCWFIKYDSWCDSIIINQCTILINDACSLTTNNLK